MNPEPIRVGDHVRIVNLLKNKKMPVGMVERINGAYIYVWVDIGLDSNEKYQNVYETYENELVKITVQEYFKLILAGANET